MLKIESIQSGNVMQLGELIMDGSTCEHIFEVVVTEPTYTEQGYTTYTCGLCGISYKRNFTELLGHDFGDDDFCTMCGTARIKDFTLQDAQSDEYTYKNGVLTIVKDGAQLTIANTDSNKPTTDTIVVNKDVSANITLAGVNIDVSDTTDACAFKIEDDSTGDVTITLADDTKNILKSGVNCAALQKNVTGDTIGTLMIQGNGSLTAVGGTCASGIGGSINGASSRINISGGIVTATGGVFGAGIGGGDNNAGSEITISGGSVKAVAGSEANKIGGGRYHETVIPIDDEGNNVYLMEINNTSEADITINGKEYPKQHSIEEQKIYAYLPAKTSAEPNVVNVGSDVQKYCYKKSKSKWLEVATIPEADDRAFECNGNKQSYTLAESEYYTIFDNLPQTDAGTYIITVTLNDPENTIWSDDTTNDQKYTFTINHVDEVYDGICDVCELYVEAKAIAKENCEELGLDDSYIGYYAISNSGNLMWFAQQVQAGNTGYKAVLTADIDMSEVEWIPIGTIDQAYTGIFDGRGHVISNVKVMGDDDTENYGVFGTVSGTVKNLGVNSLTYNGKEKNGCAGGIAGALLTGGKVDNCYVIHSTIQSTDHVIGGIVGNNAGTISNSYSYDNTLNGAENRMGGICGDYADGRITNCYTNSNELGSAGEGFAGTATDSEAGVADSRFMSGEIAYQLNGSTVQGVLAWGQKLKTEETGAEFDSLPVFKNDTNTVYYGYANCQTKEKFYSNAELYDEVPDHDWVYTQDETNKINFACDTAGCTKGGTVEIMVPTDATYHKDKQVATVQVNTEGDENLIKTPEITYSSMTEGVELVDGEPVYAGRYQASITLGEVTAYDEFEIAKAVPEIGTVSANTLENTLDINQIVLSRTDETIAGSFSLKEGTSLQYGTNDYTYVFHSQDENYADKEGTVSITITDTIVPTATYQIGTNGFKSFMNAITFGYFFKNTQNVEIEYTDDSTDKDGNILVKGSGVDAKQYYIASEIVAEEAIADIEWVEYTQPISLDKNGKYFVYTKVTDHAGNTAILNSDGIVIYEESVITTASVEYTYKSNKNISFELNANGNTFKALKDGTGNDVSVENYIVTDNSKITFKAEYLDTLNVAEQPYTYKIYMNPQGVEASNPESSKPELCYEITINVLAKALTVTGATATERTYEKGNTSVVITSIDLAGKMEGDNVSVDVTGLAGTLSDADAGNYTEVVLPKLELTGSDKGNYVLTQPSEAVPTNVTISPLTTGTATSVTNKYLYLKESADTINLEALLPKDCGAIVSYDTPNVEGNVTYKVTPSITNGTLAYTVAESSEEAIGSKGTININVKTQNYANVPISITVEFIDQIPVNPQTDVKLKDNNQKLTYGQKLSTLELPEVTFKGTDGEIVIGTLQWKNGESIPTVATEKAAWEFIPSASYNEKYANAEGELNIEVIPATPYIQVVPIATAITYGMSLNDSILNGGTVQYSKEDATTVDGTWSWKETTTKPVVADSDVTQYSVIFVPVDTDNYSKVEGTVTLTVNKAENIPNKPDSTMSTSVSQKTVGAVKLPEGWVWSEGDKAVELKAGEDNKVTATAIYDGKDKGNYVIEYVEITIVCQACTHPADKQELRDVKAATCGEAGYTGDNYCKDCGEKIETGEEISTLAHIYGEPIFNWSEDRKSCIITFTCMNDTEHISTQDATITSAIKTEATCKDKGTTTYTATYADIDKVYSAEGKRYTNTKDVVDIPVNETLHVESEILYTGDGEKEPTCTESGIGHTECMNCNQSMKSNVSIEATGHTGGTSNCKDKAVCVVCGNSYGKVSTVHTWDGGVVSKEATANEKGEKTYTCSVCKTTRTEEIPVLGEPDVEEPDVGTELISEDGSTIYLVTNVGANGNTVTYAGLKDKNATTAIVPATVTINNITYTVTAISDTAFANNKKITSVTIGDNVTSFSTKTFKGCTNLKMLNTGNGVTSIPANAFKNFKNLTTVIVGTKVKTIGKNAFYGCKKLKTVTIGKSVSKIGAKAFYGCSKLKTLTIKSTKLTTKKIGSKAFGKTPKSMTVKIPKKKMKAYKSMLKKRGVNKKARFKKI